MLIKVYCSSINIKFITKTWVYKMGWIFYTLSMTNLDETSYGLCFVSLMFHCVFESTIWDTYIFHMSNTWCDYHLNPVKLQDKVIVRCVKLVREKSMYQQYHCRSIWVVILLGPLVKWDYNASNITGVSYNYNSLIETKKGIQCKNDTFLFCIVFRISRDKDRHNLSGFGEIMCDIIYVIWRTICSDRTSVVNWYSLTIS